MDTLKSFIKKAFYGLTDDEILSWTMTPEKVDVEMPNGEVKTCKAMKYEVIALIEVPTND